MDNCVINKLQ